MDTVIKIAKCLGVDANWLMTGEEPPESLREESPPYRFTPKAPLRPPGEPTIQERLAAMEANNAEMRETLEAMRAGLDQLLDLFTNHQPKDES